MTSPVLIPVLIKRYGHRRLYHGGAGRYVTASELRRLAEDEGVPLIIRDAEDGRNITHEIILPIRY
jgi:polyhydroxyalkanoate synthesis regulator protein